jgi:hypothetical protein
MITEKNFNLLDDLNTELSIRIRKKCPSARTRGCPLRREEVMVIKKFEYQGWKQPKDTGKRWIAEIVFSLLLNEYLAKICCQRNSLLRK